MLNEDQDRRTVPRWRDSLKTVETGELTPTSTRSASPAMVKFEFLDSKLVEWQEHRTVPFAADLVGSGVALGRESEVTDAAKFLLFHSSESSPAALKLAERVLKVSEPTPPQQLHHDDDLSVKNSQKAIRDLRVRLRNQPRNALACVDIARHYSILGFNEQARRAIQNAIALAPESRFILRSTARFYVHTNDPEIAHDILKHNGRTKWDPWLLAAEIATATVAGRTSRLVKRGRGFLDTISPFQSSELASAIATLELNAGNNRGALKLFRRSLIEPTDNSVAQAEWASRRLPNLQVEQRHLNAPLSYEARAWDFYMDGKWTDAHNQCLDWFTDEPYSSGPAVLGTFIASIVLEDYSGAEQIARRSLKANAKSQSLLNNLVFALASAGKVEDATKYYSQMNENLCEGGEKISWLATGGLLFFRRGNAAEGRRLYEKAIALAKDDPFRKALAAAFLAREELLAGTPQAHAAYEGAVVANQNVKPKGMAATVNAVLERIRKTLHKKR